MQTLNIPAESIRNGDVIVSETFAGLRWPVEQVRVIGKYVEVKLTTSPAPDGYERNERVLVERAA